MPLQISGLGSTPPAQARAPAVQVRVPALHAPTLEPQVAPPPGLPSSTELLQLLSTPSQTSLLGGRPPRQNQPLEPPQVSAPVLQGVLRDPTVEHVALVGADQETFLKVQAVP